MELKDKLDLLWKYLLLLVLVVGMCSHLCHRGYGKYGCGKYSKGEAIKTCCRFSQTNENKVEIEDVQFKMQINNGDTLLKVTINGEELSEEDAKAFMKKKGNKGMWRMMKQIGSSMTDLIFLILRSWKNWLEFSLLIQQEN